MPLCKNCPDSEKVYYSGKENTPLGRGFSARFEEIGQRRKGTTRETFEVVQVGTGSGKRWRSVARISSSKQKAKKTKRKTSPRFELDADVYDNIEPNINIPGVHQHIRNRYLHAIRQIAVGLHILCRTHPEKCSGPDIVDNQVYTKVIFGIAVSSISKKVRSEVVLETIKKYGLTLTLFILHIYQPSSQQWKGDDFSPEIVSEARETEIREREYRRQIEIARETGEHKDPTFLYNFPG